MEERARRIVETAVTLAEQGGFEAVRLRDVASHAGVALGTVYKRFRSKEDILVAALEREVELHAEMVAQLPFSGETPADRACEFFAIATRAFVAKPNFARAVLRAVASGEADVHAKVARYHTRVGKMINDAMYGAEASFGGEEEEVAFLLQQIWFANLVGWMGGQHDTDELIERMRFAVNRVTS